jgi:HK97 family phage prohead protease
VSRYQTVYGIVCDRLGLSGRQELVQGPTRPELRFSAWSTPALEVRSVQAPRIPIEEGHGGEVLGEVIHLQRDSSERLWAVAHVDSSIIPAVYVGVAGETVVVEHDLFWSAERSSTLEDTDIEIRSIALTPQSARVSAQPVKFLPGALDWRGAADRYQLESGFKKDLLTRAAVTYADRPRGAPIVVYDESPTPQMKTGFRLDVPPRGRMEFRSAEQIGVSVDARTIDLIVMPAEEEALVVHEGRLVKEIVSHGAFAGTENRAGRVKVNRDHDLTRLVGKAVSLDPFSEAGLVGTLKIAKTELGNETLELAREEVLDSSAGFIPTAEGEHWETRSRRRISSAWLGHIALVSEPAYEGARVLSVRSDRASVASAVDTGSATPNLDQLRALELADKLH